MRQITVALLAALIWLTASYESSRAQIIYGEPPSVSGRLVYQKWTLSTSSGRDSSLTQIAFPVGAMIPLAPHWEVHLNSAISHSNLDDGKNSTSISSLTASAVKVYRSFADDKIFAAGGLVLPTGKTGYDTMQVAVTQLIADDYLNLPVKQVGSGVGLQFQLGGASKYEWLLYGGSISYNYSGSYKYFEQGEKYKPGDDIAVQASGTVEGSEGALDLDLAYKYYMADKVGSTEVFKNGGIFSVGISGRYEFGVTNVSLSLAEIVRSKNSLQFGSALRAEENNSNNNKTIIGGSVAYGLSSSASLSLLAEYRTLTANGYDATSEQFFGKSDLFSFGGGLTYKGFDNRYVIYSKLVFSTGEADKGAAARKAISITGTEISVGGRIQL